MPGKSASRLGGGKAVSPAPRPGRHSPGFSVALTSGALCRTTPVPLSSALLKPGARVVAGSPAAPSRRTVRPTVTVAQSSAPCA
ncbi:hypothetical protein [Candidatus Amarolinea dominans]|uniref:hypothetical protein n=1 Tax=Candidatus Amarolinea dominans TaxID=3140696 RepID=UPI003136CCC2|nr:hypothetical protein [Anaerolineae bacterium]